MGLATLALTTLSRLASFCVSDGSSVVATRYITSATEEAASLYFSTGSTFEEYAPGSFKMTKADKRERIILIACVPPGLRLRPRPGRLLHVWRY